RPDRALFVKPRGGVGQIPPIAASLRHEGSVAAAVSGVDVVVNLVGILHGRGANSFAAIHVEGAARAARAARAAGVKTFVQMSALGADPDSPAEYGRSKAAGEQAVREVIPAAGIARPSIVFGPEDNFFNRFATMARFLPALPLIGGGRTLFQPVYVGDVADALLRLVEDPATAGKTYELGGPRVYSFRELLEILLKEIGRRRLLLPVPFGLASLVAFFLELPSNIIGALPPLRGALPAPPLTQDQVQLLRSDNVVGAGLTLDDLGIRSTAPELVLSTYLARYRRGGRFVSPVSS